MANIIKGLNTACVLHNGNFLALCIKVKNSNNEEEKFFLQATMLRDFLLILGNRLQIITPRITNENDELKTLLQEEANNLLSHIPAIDVAEVQQPEAHRRIATLVMKPHADSCLVHFILQNESVYSLSIKDTQVDFIGQAIMQALTNSGFTEIFKQLTACLDFLPLYDAEFDKENSIQYDQHVQDAWKQNLFSHHLALIYKYKNKNDEDAYLGAVVKTNAQPETPEAQSIALRLVRLSEKLRPCAELPCQIYSTLIPSLSETILTLEESLRPLKDFRIKIMENK